MRKLELPNYQTCQTTTTTVSLPTYKYDKCHTRKTNPVPNVVNPLSLRLEGTHTGPDHLRCEPHILHAHLDRYLSFQSQPKVWSPAAPADIWPWTSSLPTTLSGHWAMMICCRKMQSYERRSNHLTFKILQNSHEALLISFKGIDHYRAIALSQTLLLEHLVLTSSLFSISAPGTRPWIAMHARGLVKRSATTLIVSFYCLTSFFQMTSSLT